MSRNCSVTFDWADGTYTFRLRLGELEELQSKCDAGPEILHARISSGFPSARDLHEVMRLGLIGGGMEPPKALNLVRRYVDDMPRKPNHLAAAAVIAAAIVGVEDDPAGKPGPDAETAAANGGATAS